MTDLIVAGLLLILALPLMAVIAAAIKLDSGGSVLFSQERVGLGGRIFTIHKFRSMLALAPRYSYKVPLEDPRITRVGRVLRRSGLDELPQLWNVIRGDMALIGPRPELPFIVEQYQPMQHIRHSIRPGVTGWWQIHQRDTPRTMDEDSADAAHLGRFAYDLFYLDHLSFKLDLDITIRTARLMSKCLLRPNREHTAPLSEVAEPEPNAAYLAREGTGANG
jgi:lipopolysaccharide/colanic/teichoic acid biosynthesis glycosyltransferase